MKDLKLGSFIFEGAEPDFIFWISVQIIEPADEVRTRLK